MTDIAFQPGHDVTPLIQASETYAAIEAAIEDATDEVCMAYWSLAPGIRLTGDETETWEDLLHRALGRGVCFRIILADFDPVFTMPLHRNAWETFGRLSDLEEAGDGRLQVICSQNPARPNLFETIMGNLAAQRELGEAVESLNSELQAGADASEILRTVPGLWRHVVHRSGRLRRRIIPRVAELLPGSHHEKLCIIDRRIAFLGGLDIGDRLYDTPEHDDDFPWHDLACRIQGPAVADLTSHFVERWNRELPQFHTYVENLRNRPERDLIAASGLTAMEDDGHENPPEGEGEVAVLASTADLGDAAGNIGEGVHHLIGQAERLVYIETQFLREQAVVDWLIEAADNQPELEVITLVPVAPDRLEPDGDWSIATKHGHWLQLQSIERLTEALGERFGVFTLASRQPVEEGDAPEDTALNAKAIYVHAKTIIVDDHTAMVGSANLNDRSFRLDTETAVLWHEPQAVRAYRQRLWQMHLGDLLPDDHDPIAQVSLPLWRAAAAANLLAQTDERPGFVVPMQSEWAKLNAKQSRLIRDRYV